MKDYTQFRLGPTKIWHACPKWYAAFTTVPFLFLLCLLPIHRLYIRRMDEHTHVSALVEIIYEPPFLSNTTANETFLHKSRVVHIHHWAAGLAVTG
jgi:hypothetical protein